MVRTPITLLRKSLKDSVHLITGKALEILGVSGVLLLLDLQSSPLGLKVFHHIGLLEIGGGVVSASGIVVLNQVGGNL
jgi:hypothetical protein